MENEQSCFLLCDSHMELVLRVEAHYDCTSEEEDGLIFDEVFLGRMKGSVFLSLLRFISSALGSGVF